MAKRRAELSLKRHSVSGQVTAIGSAIPFLFIYATEMKTNGGQRIGSGVFTAFFFPFTIVDDWKKPNVCQQKNQ